MSHGNFGGTFDANSVPPQQSFEPIPTGWYKAMMIDSQVGPTKAGTGTKMSAEWQVIEGEYDGRKIFDNVNLANPNPKAQQIGQEQLSAICHATGALQVSDSTQLHNLPCLIRVKIRPASGEYDAGNEIKGYRHVNNPPRTMQNAAPAVPTPPAPQAPAPTPPAPQPAQQVTPPPAAPPQAPPVAAIAPAQPTTTTQPTAGTPPWKT